MSSSRNLRRLVKRPHPDEWSEDELMTLAEAAALHWPEGPITVATLRTAVRSGKLAVTVIAGKLFTTRREIATLSRCEVLHAAAPSDIPSKPLGRMTKDEARAWLTLNCSAVSDATKRHE